jgi:hypothetical protein
MFIFQNDLKGLMFVQGNIIAVISTTNLVVKKVLPTEIDVGRLYSSIWVDSPAEASVSSCQTNISNKVRLQPTSCPE